MKTLKVIGLIVLVLIVLLLLVSQFLPGKGKVERSIVIKADQHVIFDQLNTLKNWPKWSPWHKMDTTMTLVYTGPESGTGAAYEWNSKNSNLGTGKYKILSSNPDDSILNEMDFMKGRVSTGGFYLSKAEDGVKVTWKFEMKYGHNPVARFMGLFMGKFVGKDFEKGLNNLKEVAEKLPSFHVEEVKTKGQIYVSIRAIVPMSDIQMTMGKNFGILMQFIGQNGIKCIGAPFALYNSEPKDNKMDVEAALPVDKKVSGKGDIKCSEMLEGKALSILYTGPFDKIGPAWQTLMSYAKDNHKEMKGAPYEVYLTDPQKEPDSTKWQTQLFYPVK